MRHAHMIAGMIMLSSTPISAETCKVASRSSPAAVTPSGLTIAPFAIPVAVPVATISQPAVFYGYSQYRTAVPAQTEKINAAEQPATTAAAVLQQRCAACHAGPNAKGGFELPSPRPAPGVPGEGGKVSATPNELSRDQRLEILDRVTSSDPQRRMPPDGPALAPDELRILLQELVR